MCVAVGSVSSKTLLLYGSRALDAAPDSGRAFRFSTLTQIPKRYCADAYMHVNSVRERTGNSGPIPRQIGRRAGAGSAGISRLPTGTGIRGSNQGELRRICDARRSARYDHAGIFHWLAHTFQDGARELQHLIEKKNSVVRETHLARPRMTPATNQSCTGD